MGRTFIKYILKMYLFFFNIFLWLVAIGILGGVGYYFSTSNEYKDLATDNSVVIYTVIPLVVLVLVALMLLLLSVLGLIGSCCDVKVLIGLYGVLLAIVVSAQVVGGVLVVVFRGPVLAELEKGLAHNIAAYKNDTTVREVLDTIQTGLQCCGAQGVDDYAGSVIPDSCCKNTGCVTSNTDNLNNVGCVAKLEGLITQSSAVSISIAILLALIMYSGVAVAFILTCCCPKKDSEDLIEAKRMLPKY